MRPATPVANTAGNTIGCVVATSETVIEPPATLPGVRITEIAVSPTAEQRRQALALVASIETTSGSSPLSDHLRIDLGRDADDADDAGGVDGADDRRDPLLVSVRDDQELVGFAQLAEANDAWVLEVVVDPNLDDRLAVRDDLAETAVDAHRRRRSEPVVWWLDDPAAHDHDVATDLGLAVWRELYEMRRPLPHPRRADVSTRAFRPGTDDEAWLAVNNRAFATHGEQGGWTLDTLRLRFGEPWFDADGFRVFEDDGGELVAFCWTKLHTGHDPVIGEIYVIAVDPSAHGRGLGTQLTLAGLDSIADRGVTVANLYVDAGNTAAVGLYERLGFEIHHRRVAFAPPAHVAS